MEDYCILAMWCKSSVVFNFVEFILVFRNYVRQSERNEIKLYESLPRYRLLNKCNKSSDPVLSFLEKPQTTLKVILTFQYFNYFLGMLEGRYTVNIFILP